MCPSCLNRPRMRSDSGQRLALLVRPVRGGERLEDVGDSHAARLHRHLRPGEPARIALAVHALVVASRVLRHVLEVPRPRQRLEHPDRDVDVVIDDAPLLARQRAGRDRQVFHLVHGEEVAFRAVGVAPAVPGGNVPDPLQVLRPHGFRPDVARAKKGAVRVDRGQARRAIALGIRQGLLVTVLQGLQPGLLQLQADIAPDDLEPRVDGGCGRRGSAAWSPCPPRGPAWLTFPQS